jgi:hypothetical protein
MWFLQSAWQSRQRLSPISYRHVMAEQGALKREVEVPKESGKTSLQYVLERERQELLDQIQELDEKRRELVEEYTRVVKQIK